MADTTIALSPDPANSPSLIAIITPAPAARGTRRIRSKAALERLRAEFDPAPTLVYDDPASVDDLPDEDPED